MLIKDPLKACIYLFLIGFLLYSLVVKAVDSIRLDVQQITAENWQANDIALVAKGFSLNQQSLELTISKLELPEPLKLFSLINLRCDNFVIADAVIQCVNGDGHLQNQLLQHATFNFNLYLGRQKQSLSLKNLHLAGGVLSVAINQQSTDWQVALQIHHLDLGFLAPFVKQLMNINSGRLSAKMNLNGREQALLGIDADITLDNTHIQSVDARYETQDLGLQYVLHARNMGTQWQWRYSVALNHGVFYAEPLLLNIEQQPVTMQAQGLLDTQLQTLSLQSASYVHPGIAQVESQAEFVLQPEFKIKRANMAFSSDYLQGFSEVYLQPLLDATAWEGLQLAGAMNLQVNIQQQQLTNLQLKLQQLQVYDLQQRFTVQQANGTIHWSNAKQGGQPSELSWEKLQLFALPIGPSQLSFLARGGGLNLLKATTLPFFDGTVRLNWFSFLKRAEQEPDLRFEGEINQVSLQHLSTALGWPQMSGNLSGKIPGIHLRKGKLGIDGELSIQVFNGVVKISQLAVSGLFAGLPQFYSDIEIHNLDLLPLTSKFEFGNIEGRLSGFVRNLYMENWRPQSFYAWLGTPENDNSRHRISQKAIDNLANIGGGGAANVISKSFLGIFENFSYDRLGVGCYLHNGVCQMLGVEAAGAGYYIIKGGGLPRINVIGYNPQVDWQVLLQRLARLKRQ